VVHGRGICYELNSALVELLRHLGLPSAVVTGWVLDSGRISHPDHLFAAVLLPCVEGLCLMPLDAATNSRGPIHALPAAPSQPPSVLPQRPQVPTPGGVWSLSPSFDVTTPDVDALIETVRSAEQQRMQAEALLLERVILSICLVGKRPPPTALASLRESPLAERNARLHALAAGLLPDPALVGTLLALWRGEFEHLPALPADVQRLVSLGLARVKSASSFRVEPIKT
jgi:hypothetical protein